MNYYTDLTNEQIVEECENTFDYLTPSELVLNIIKYCKEKNRLSSKQKKVLANYLNEYDLSYIIEEIDYLNQEII